MKLSAVTGRFWARLSVVYQASTMASYIITMFIEQVIPDLYSTYARGYVEAESSLIEEKTSSKLVSYSSRLLHNL